jgi:hypothetical protein
MCTVVFGLAGALDVDVLLDGAVLDGAVLCEPDGEVAPLLLPPPLEEQAETTSARLANVAARIAARPDRRGGFGFVTHSP